MIASEPSQSLRPIDRLFPSVGLARFVADFYPDRLLIEDGPLDRLGELGVLSAFDHPIGLIDGAPGDTVVVYVRSPSGSTQQIGVDKPTAVRLFKSGFTVSIERADAMIPAVGKWARSLRADLGYGPDARDVALLISPPGEAVPMHFDSTEVLIVHLRGRKRWQIAENATLRYPTTSWFPSERDGQDLRVRGVDADERRLEQAFDWPKQMPPSARTHDMAPGSATLLPRGWWHQTYAHDRTVSLTFKVGAPCARAIVIEALDRRLRALEAWRAPLPLWGGHAPRARSDARLQDLVGTLAALANRCELAPLLGAPRALRKLGAGFRAVAPSANRRGWTLAVSVRGETHELRLDVDPTELCRALDGASATVSEAELRNAIPDASLSGLHALVAKLVKLGALEIAAPAGDGAG